jgi:hypothetical protein
MSLLETASLIVTPNGYKEGKLYSVIPSDGSGDMSVVRATTATRVNSAGLVELVPYNLFQYSEDFGNAYWAKTNATITTNTTTAPNFTLTADTITDNATNGQHKVQTAALSDLASGASFVASAYIKANTATRACVYAYGTSLGVGVDLLTGNQITVSGLTNASPGNVTINNVGNGWYYIELRSTVAGAFSIAIMMISGTDFAYTGSGNSLYYWGAQLTEGTTAKPYQKTETRLNIPRLDYSNGSCPSLLVEPQRTNLALFSEQFNDAAWTKESATITSNSVIAPNGTTTADTFTATATNASHYLSQNINVTTGNTITFSCYVKNNGGNFVQLVAGGTDFTPVDPYQNFNLQTGTLASGNITNSTITNVGNGWFRISSSVTSTSTAVGYFFIAPILNGTSGRLSAFTGDGTSGIYIWGAQLELGAYATSYIPTASASVTRNADTCTKTGISSLIGQTEGTIFLDLDNIPYNSDWLTLNPISGSPYTNGIGIGYFSSTVRLQLYSPSGTIFATLTPISGRNKIAIGYKSGDTVIYVNGVNVFSSAGTFSFGVLLDSITVGSSSWIIGSTATNKIYSHSLYNTRLTNSELIQLTTP